LAGFRQLANVGKPPDEKLLEDGVGKNARRV